MHKFSKKLTCGGLLFLTKNIAKKITKNSVVKKKSVSIENKDNDNDNDKYIKKLNMYNKYAFYIQTFNTIFQYYYVYQQKNNKDPKNLPFKTKLYKTSIPRENILETNRKKVGSFLVGELMVLFSFITALSHLSLFTFRKDNYNKYIEKQINPQRWLEYTLTSSIMMFGFMGVSQIDSLEELIPLTTLIGITNIIGLAIESIKNIENNYIRNILFYSGSVTNGLPWFYIGYRNSSLFKRTRDEIKNTLQTEKLKGQALEEAVDRFINTIIPAIKILTYTMQGLYYTFSFNMNQKYIKPMRKTEILKPRQFYELERNYIFLSMISKSLLSWTIWSATLRPND